MHLFCRQGTQRTHSAQIFNNVEYDQIYRHFVYGIKKNSYFKKKIFG